MEGRGDGLRLGATNNMASAICTSNSGRSYADFIDRTEFPKLPLQRVPKQPGSKKLVHGEWVVVKPDDEDAVHDDVESEDQLEENGPAQSLSVRGAEESEGPALIGSRRLGGPTDATTQLANRV